MIRVHHKPRSRDLGSLVGWALCIAGAFVGALLIYFGLSSGQVDTEPKALVTTLLGVSIVLFFVAGLPKGARSGISDKPPHTNR
ncbi:hypothetical protein [Pseudomonas sp. S1(2024)]|uniref:hypothetical protein n=1 Tax=Pseudomonas sp. S1(2024) TaxID=3390191 RepID=UPI00397CF25E